MSSTKEIIINIFRNPEYKIDLNIKNTEEENLKDINTLIIKSNDNDFEEETKNNTFYFFNKSSSNNIEKNTNRLILKNINVDLSKSNIYFKSLKILSLNNSSVVFSLKENNFSNFEYLENLIIKGDLNLIKNNLLNLRNNKLLHLINQITIKIVSKSSSKVDLFNLIKSLEFYILNIKKYFNIYFKGLLADLNLNKIEKIEDNILSKIKKLHLFSLIKINSNTCKIIKEELIDKLNNLEELYINDNIECDIQNKLKYFNYINNNEDININYNLYNIDKLNKISIPICEYNKSKKSLLLYGEANMSFYNSNNKELLLKIIKNNHNGNLTLLSLCNFDYENIDYMNELIDSINSSEKIIIQNLNINDKFISLIKNKNLFNSKCVTIDNIIFTEDEIENNFYEYINSYKDCKYLKLVSLEDIGKYKDLILNENVTKLYFEEIYDMNYELLKELILSKKIIMEITLKNLEIVEDKNKDLILDIILHCKDEIKKLKIIGNEFNFIYKEIQEKKIQFKKIEKLILHLEKEEDNDEKGFLPNDKEKINYLEKNYQLFNYDGIKKIDLGIYSISLNERKKIMNIFKNLYEIY